MNGAKFDDDEAYLALTADPIKSWLATVTLEFVMKALVKYFIMLWL